MNNNFEENENKNYEPSSYSMEPPKKKGISVILAIFIALMCSFVTFAVTLYSLQTFVNNNFANLNARQAKFERLYKLDSFVRANFAYEIDDELLMDGILAGYMAGLDDQHSYYLNSDNFEMISVDLVGEFVGIGIKVALDDETKLIRVTAPMNNSPAAEAGILPGDLIYTAEGESVTDIGYNVAVNKLLGKEGTEAHFTVLREGVEEPIEFSVIRKKFKVETVEHKTLSNGYGYVKIFEFDKSTLNQFKGAIADLTEKKVPGIIFDVRNNPGGELETICSILDILVPEGNIIEIVGKGGKIVDTRKSKPNELNLPMIVITNEQTYSAAELFAATLRDYEKAILVGETTYGKGSMQTIYPMENNTGINITVNKYNPPSGVSYDGIGIKPHVEILLPDDLKGKRLYLTLEEDNQLQGAISELEKLINKN